jgi:hypothetical protein
MQNSRFANPEQKGKSDTQSWLTNPLDLCPLFKSFSGSFFSRWLTQKTARYI